MVRAEEGLITHALLAAVCIARAPAVGGGAVVGGVAEDASDEGGDAIESVRLIVATCHDIVPARRHRMSRREAKIALRHLAHEMLVRTIALKVRRQPTVQEVVERTEGRIVSLLQERILHGVLRAVGDVRRAGKDRAGALERITHVHR